METKEVIFDKPVSLISRYSIIKSYEYNEFFKKFSFHIHKNGLFDYETMNSFNNLLNIIRVEVDKLFENEEVLQGISFYKMFFNGASISFSVDFDEENILHVLSYIELCILFNPEKINMIDIEKNKEKVKEIYKTFKYINNNYMLRNMLGYVIQEKLFKYSFALKLKNLKNRFILYYIDVDYVDIDIKNENNKPKLIFKISKCNQIEYLNGEKDIQKYNINCVTLDDIINEN